MPPMPPFPLPRRSACVPPSWGSHAIRYRFITNLVMKWVTVFVFGWLVVAHSEVGAQGELHTNAARKIKAEPCSTALSSDQK